MKRVASLLALVLLAGSPTAWQALHQTWTHEVKLCVRKVEQHTERPVRYVINRPDTLLHTMTDRQERLFFVCLDVVEGR